MSIEALNWALNKAPVEDSGLAAVLLGLANHANPDGSDCWPSVERLSYYARMSERTVRRHLRTLEEMRVIVRDEDTRTRDARTRADQRPTVYRLVMDGPTREDYETRRDRLRTERQKVDGGSDCPPVATGGQIDRGDNDDTTGGHGDPRTVPDPSPLSPPTSERERAHEDDGQTALPVAAPAEPAKGKKKPGIPEDWKPSEELRARTAERYPHVDIDTEVAKFVNWHLGQKSKWTDWTRAWWHWVGNCKPPRSGRPGPYRNPQTPQGQDATQAAWESWGPNTGGRA